MKQKKGAVTVGVLVLTIVMLFVAISVVGYSIKTIKLLSATDDGVCSLSLLLNSISKVGGKPIISPECTHKNIEITGADLNKIDNDKGEVYEAFSTNMKTLKNTKVQSDTIVQYRNYYDTSKLPEWYVQQVVAQELKSCWDKVGKGNYDLFNDLETFFKDCSKDKSSAAVDRCETGSGFLSTIWMAAKNIDSSLENSHKVPKFCLLCSRIKFEDLKNEGYDYTNREIKDPWLWLYNNKVPKDKVSYFEYLSENTYYHNTGKKVYDTFNTNQNQAVIYVKERRFEILKDSIWIAQKSMEFVSENQNFFEEYKDEKGNDVDFKQYTEIVSYEDLPNKCTYLIG